MFELITWIVANGANILMVGMFLLTVYCVVQIFRLPDHTEERSTIPLTFDEWYTKFHAMTIGPCVRPVMARGEIEESDLDMVEVRQWFTSGWTPEAAREEMMDRFEDFVIGKYNTELKVNNESSVEAVA